jgi:hypothetical protein
MRLKWFISIGIFIIVIAVVSVYAISRGKLQPPAPLVVPVCSNIQQGVTRLGFKPTGTLFSIQVDVPDDDFVIRSATRDMPPSTLYSVTRKGENATMEVADGGSLSFTKSDTAFRLFSQHSVARDVHSAQGQVVGKDQWGYLSTGESWRHVTFSWGDEIGYKPLTPRDAKALDEVIGSACLLSAPKT